MRKRTCACTSNTNAAASGNAEASLFRARSRSLSFVRAQFQLRVSPRTLHAFRSQRKERKTRNSSISNVDCISHFLEGFFELWRKKSVRMDERTNNRGNYKPRCSLAAWPKMKIILCKNTARVVFKIPHVDFTVLCVFYAPRNLRRKYLKK